VQYRPISDDTGCIRYSGKDCAMLSSVAKQVVAAIHSKSLRWQFAALCAATVLACGAGTLGVLALSSVGTTGDDSKLLHWRVAVVVLAVGIVATLCGIALIGRMLRPIHQFRQAMAGVMSGRYDVASTVTPTSSEFGQLHDTFGRMLEHLRVSHSGGDEAKRFLAARTLTVDRMLEFSQTIQGAGKAEQVFETLSFYLRAELNLAGLVVLSHEPDATPSTEVKSAWPADILSVERAIADVDSQVCPCLRQNLPKLFACEHSPIRCAIDSILSLSKAHPAYCLPFNMRKGQCVAHMMLPIDQEWTDERKQLAQTYVNTAQTTLVSLHLLAEAEKQSMTDVLTGLYNRRSMESLLQREVALCERHGHAMSVVMIDMDKFKEVNDTHGHAAGDHMLRSFADCVRITLRKTDLAFRYGGDEFCIALPQTTIEQAQAVVQKLRQAYMSVDFSDAIANLDHQPTLSIGVAQRSKPSVLTLQAILSAADAALYDANNSNRNCIRLYTPPQAA
jgi:diguanylate cyclase (GGDEF)-like protein